MLSIVKGTDREYTFTFYTSSGDPFDIEGCSISANFYRNDSTLSLEKDLTPSGIGSAKLTFVPEDTEHMLGTYTVHIMLEDPSEKIISILSAPFQVMLR
jgi:hypothetical protein